MMDRKAAGAVVGTWDEVFGACAPHLRQTAEAARTVILQQHGGAVEVARPGERSVVFGFGPAKMKEGYAYLMPHAGWINLGFPQGTALPDPAGLLGGAGKSYRHVKLRAPEEAARPEVVELIRAAVVERRATLGRYGDG